MGRTMKSRRRNGFVLRKVIEIGSEHFEKHAQKAIPLRRLLVLQQPLSKCGLLIRVVAMAW
eukprot:11224550-Lingulodinium_polyedra.AAC.1